MDSQVINKGELISKEFLTSMELSATDPSSEGFLIVVEKTKSLNSASSCFSKPTALIFTSCCCILPVAILFITAESLMFKNFVRNSVINDEDTASWEDATPNQKRGMEIFVGTLMCLGYCGLCCLCYLGFIRPIKNKVAITPGDMNDLLQYLSEQPTLTDSESIVKKTTKKTRENNIEKENKEEEKTCFSSVKKHCVIL